MRPIALLLILTVGPLAQAQHQTSNWLHVDYTYSDFAYKESQMSEKGRVSGVRGEVGFAFMRSLAISAGGEYWDDNLNYDGATFSGTPVKQVTKDYMRDLRLMAHVVYAPLVFSFGMAERYWYDNLVVSYVRRTEYKYNPLVVSYFLRNAYISYEHDFWGKGTNTSEMSIVNPARRNVSFKLGEGSGMGVEIGYFIPGPLIATRLFLRYHKWTVKQSDVQNDGVDNLVEPDNSTTLIQGGIGLAF